MRSSWCFDVALGSSILALLGLAFVCYAQCAILLCGVPGFRWLIVYLFVLSVARNNICSLYFNSFGGFL